MLRVFTNRMSGWWRSGSVGFRFIGASFIPMVTSLVFPVFFQAVGAAVKSSLLTIVRTVVLFVPLGAHCSPGSDWTWFWLTFPCHGDSDQPSGPGILPAVSDAHPYVRRRAAHRPGPPLRPSSSPSRPGVIVTIAREHGSSGKEIGRPAGTEQLGVPFYYKEMTALAAQESGLDREFISGLNRNAPKALYDLYLSTKVVRLAVAAAASDHREESPSNGSCVIVGRAADYVLRDQDNVVKVFIHASKEYRIGRVMEIYGDTHEEAEENIRSSDRARAAYYRHISGKRWGEAANYDLVVDSSQGVRQAADEVVQYLYSAKRYF